MAEKVKTTSKISPGKPEPIGATCLEGGVNFSIYSHKANGVDLLFYSEVTDSKPSRIITLDPSENKSANYWHVWIADVRPGQLYAYRIHGPNNPEKGLRFDPSKVLLDPYAKAIVDDSYRRADATEFGKSNDQSAMKCVVVDPADYDWEGDEPLKRPLNDAVIYEMHVRGFTRHPSSGVEENIRGTYAGLIEKIPYLKKLGIRCVQLMPVFQFDRQSGPNNGTNYWGYEPVGFFAPHRGYSSDKSALGPVNEFRDMVKALHKAGIEVLLDVVFNHTAEDDAGGPTFLFRGIDNRTYYLLEDSDQAVYTNDTGTGNTINANHSVVRRMIMDSLEYWVQEMHVDGFRFDLASVLSRGTDGEPMKDPPILWSIDTDPKLAHTKIIAEAWDAGGLYQVGCFVGDRWAVLNGHFRDTVRRFIRGDEGLAHDLADVIAGSANLFNDNERNPQRSINFITAHDGFTLNDLVSYNHKHNEANGNNNTDGTDANFSKNYGVEGPSRDPVIETVRQQQIKNFLAILLLSQGQPLISMGDEVRRTLHGNNNPYTLDTELNWFDWRLIPRHEHIFRFVRELLKMRTTSYIFTSEIYWSRKGGTDIIWHGKSQGSPDWSYFSHTLAIELYQENREKRYYAIINSYTEEIDFELPALSEHESWALAIDTANLAPNDIIPLNEQTPYGKSTYHSRPHSVTVFGSMRK